MRIISGTLGGRVIPSPPSNDTRPTTDAAREMLFSVLDTWITWNGLRVLDLCAGTGSLGFEAISRGAASVVFVDRSKPCIKTIEETIRDFGVSDHATTIHSDVLEALRYPLHNKSFDVVFADPPYHAKLHNKITLLLERNGILVTDGIYIAEHGENEALILDEGWEKLDHRRRGPAVIDIIRRVTKP
ncbi:MAG TPA: 16S rRNA (guanine(966)-N(2))-methyltransferase RsmD [Bacteroidetes bacterium]|nr:16S rRNA (guanine(966)-N(2))-methyltransferase RsmD [Bacteroidota bacterium]HRK03995.1 16S rRNA (guanine(966)-N(2))-methyltransferase RsmD [Chlorobiota bacterium]